MLKSYGVGGGGGGWWWVVVVAWSNLVSAQGPLVLGLGLNGLGLRVWGQGLTIYQFLTGLAASSGAILGGLYFTLVVISLTFTQTQF